MSSIVIPSSSSPVVIVLGGAIAMACARIITTVTPARKRGVPLFNDPFKLTYNPKNC